MSVVDEPKRPRKKVETILLFISRLPNPIHSFLIMQIFSLYSRLLFRKVRYEGGKNNRKRANSSMKNGKYRKESEKDKKSRENNFNLKFGVSKFSSKCHLPYHWLSSRLYTFSNIFLCGLQTSSFKYFQKF